MIFFAHVGDYVGVLYLAPMLIIVAVLVVQNIRDRRRGVDSEGVDREGDDKEGDDGSDRDEPVIADERVIADDSDR